MNRAFAFEPPTLMLIDPLHGHVRNKNAFGWSNEVSQNASCKTSCPRRLLWEVVVQLQDPRTVGER